MITKDEIRALLHSTETYRIERTVSKNDMDKFQEAICAFSNDLPNSRQKGYLIIGANDDGSMAGMRVDDALLKKISAIRSDGNILPLPIMSVDRYEFEGGDLLVAEVTPSLVPPVRYRGRTFVRIGPRRDIASEAEERILFERRASYMASFDATPCIGATIHDLEVDVIRRKYLPKVVDTKLLKTDQRTIEEQLAAIGMFDMTHQCPTYAAMVLFGTNPRRFLPGAYVQFVRFAGINKSSQVEDEREFSDNYCELLPKLETFLEMAVIKQYPVPVSTLREDQVTNYPYWAIRELLMNACMHRDLQSNTPLRFYEFADHIEILNAGGLYGNARPENFPNVNDYRNPLIAGAMKSLGYVNKYNRGIGQVKEELMKNGNPPAEYKVNLLTAFAVTIHKGTSRGHKSVTERAQVEGTSWVQDKHPFGRNILTLKERVVEFCSTPKSMAEIAEFLGVKNKRKARERYVDPQIGVTLQRTVPDKPTSRLQKYVAI